MALGVHATLGDSRGRYSSLPSADPDSNGRRTSIIGDCDIVQFSTQIYFVEENEGVLNVDVMRLGNLVGQASVCYRTQDGSAKAGERYAATSGILEFGDGEWNKTFQVQVINTNYWCPTLEFKIILTDPFNCSLGNYLWLCRVKVIDNELFPSSKYSIELQQGDVGLQSISGFGLLLEYFKLNFTVQGVGWRTLLTLAMDQLKNMYLYLTLSIGIYLVDVLFQTESDMTEDDRFPYVNSLIALGGLEQEMAPWLVGGMYILPMLILHTWDLLRVYLNLGGISRHFLQTSLFRKYLNYSEASRLKVDPTTVHGAITGDAPRLAESYVAALEVLQLFGKLTVLTVFTLRENPDAWRAVVAMPSLMLIFACCRYTVLLRYSRLVGDSEISMATIVSDTCHNYRLIAAYRQRPMMNEVFCERAEEYSSLEIQKNVIVLNNNYWSKWLGPLFTGIFVITKARSVVDRDLSLGKFLATIGIFQSISSDFAELYKLSMVITNTLNPLKDLTTLFNMETDLRLWKALNRERRAMTGEARAKVMQEPLPPNANVQLKTDLIPIMLIGMSFKYPGLTLFENVNISTSQGKLIAVVGAHGAGKFTFFEILGSSMFPEKGFVFIPSHLRTLLVPQEPMMLNLSLWGNLVLGCPNKKADPMMVRSILQALDMAKALEVLDEESLSGSEDDLEWLKNFTYTAKVKIHLARALIMNPEVLVLQRPLHHYDARTKMSILQVLKTHVQNRGLCMPAETMPRRRPRTVFLTPESVQEAAQADEVWQIDTDRKDVFPTSSDELTEDFEALPPKRMSMRA